MTAQLPGKTDLVVSFKVEGVEQLGRVLEGMARTATDLTDVWKDVAATVIFPSIMKNFAAQGRPRPWPQLDPDYARRKMKKYGAQPILVGHGRLLSAFAAPGASGDVSVETSPSRLAITLVGDTAARSGLFYGIFHTSSRPRKMNKRGRAKLPRREFFMLQAEDVDAIVAKIHEHLIRTVRWPQAPP